MIMSKKVKYFLICAIVCAAGIVLAFAGYAAGGAKNMSKVTEHHPWIRVGSSETITDNATEKVGDFNTIEVDGPMDVLVVAPGYEPDTEGLTEFFSFENSVIGTETMDGAPGTVDMRWPKGKDKPEITNDNGVLKVKVKEGYSDYSDYTVNINFDTIEESSAGSSVPYLVIHCASDELDKIKIVDSCGDVAILGEKGKVTDVHTDYGGVAVMDAAGDELTVSGESADTWIADSNYGKMSIGTQYGDVTISGCESDITADMDDSEVKMSNCKGKISVKGDCCDAYFSGCEGDISAETSDGEIVFKTNLPKDKFGVTLSTNLGEVTFGESTFDMVGAGEYKNDGGPNKLTFKTDFGDISVKFKD